MTDAQTPKWVDPERDPMQVAAADWVGRLSNSNVSVEETLEWQQWMKADVRHAQAFSRFEQISRALKTMEAPRVPWKWQLTRDVYDGSVPLSEWREHAARLKWAHALAASVVLAISVMTWAVISSGWPPWTSESVLFTAIGENRTLKLSDGSRVTLGGASRLEWGFTQKERTLELRHGEALFHVAKDATRPFKVRAGDATVVALGTVFNVHRGSSHTVVAVTDGRVVVEPTPRMLPIALLREFKPKLRPVRVDAGEQTTAGSAGIEKASRVEDLAAATSWQTGRLSFRLQPLRDVLEDVNRYVKKPVVAADDQVGSLVVSGTVIGENVAGWVESLEHAFGLTAVEKEDQIVLKAQ